MRAGSSLVQWQNVPLEIALGVGMGFVGGFRECPTCLRLVRLVCISVALILTLLAHLYLYGIGPGLIWLWMGTSGEARTNGRRA